MGMIKFIFSLGALALTIKPNDQNALQLEAGVCQRDDQATQAPKKKIRDKSGDVNFFDSESAITEIAGQGQLDVETKLHDCLLMMYSPFCPHCKKEKPFFA